MTERLPIKYVQGEGVQKLLDKVTELIYNLKKEMWECVREVHKLNVKIGKLRDKNEDQE